MVALIPGPSPNGGEGSKVLSSGEDLGEVIVLWH